jgi:hypothetical protein
MRCLPSPDHLRGMQAMDYAGISDEMDPWQCLMA